MAIEIDTYLLEDIARDHRIGVEVFVPFAIIRLRGKSTTNEVSLTIRLQDISSPGETQRRLHLSWSPESVPKSPLGVQEHTITEWAAYGVACVVVMLYTGLRVHEVAANGDRFDFWVGDSARQYGLEVSGTMLDEVEPRHRVKVRQWHTNPYGVDGYVVVAGFATQEVLLSFHRFQEGVG